MVYKGIAANVKRCRRRFDADIIFKSPFVIARGSFTHRRCPSVCPFVCLSPKSVHKTRFSQKLSSIELWSLLTTYRKSYIAISQRKTIWFWSNLGLFHTQQQIWNSMTARWPDDQIWKFLKFKIHCVGLVQFVAKKLMLPGFAFTSNCRHTMHRFRDISMDRQSTRQQSAVICTLRRAAVKIRKSLG